ncbi:uncharacterized protein LOC127853213 isoform X2 [Dreissena polymorpha]|uniref:uncharacterized protein LOC127853213 isoform X2 n=1 Tax=Dreissena polymorpha TaxID=45954 RepID=UPI002264EADC|nr:uncharacterized protein LOC127853213 isoform X2 [Dreissena polymorpha]
MKIILCLFFLACARTVVVSLEYTCTDAGLYNCNAGEGPIMLYDTRHLQFDDSAMPSAFAKADHFYRETNRIVLDVLKYISRLRVNTGIYHWDSTMASSRRVSDVVCRMHSPIDATNTNRLGVSFCGVGLAVSRAFNSDAIGAVSAGAVAVHGYMLQQFEVRVMYQLKDTSLYMQLNDKNQISAVYLDDISKDSGVYVIRKVYASDNKLYNLAQIGLNGTSWIQVLGNTTTLATQATLFKTYKNGDDIRFEYNDTCMCFDENGHTLDMISTNIALQNKRFHCVFIEIPV